ncbi:fibronectin type III domain-containing protein [uncultured Psychroserpens sp.]|uniref:fibronectin type III domain-containing protein n=1 Tax=uncultured Psychroserpens sp. TaxID=255436 RepID=UPI0026284E9F|nr:fibronectin type III domain-containing protein [uncultured Psychroserpens sp.]
MKRLSFLCIFSLFLFACNNDDDTVAACSKATNILASNITTTSVTLSWQDSNNAASYIIEYGISGFVIGTGTTALESNTTLDLNNLLPETTYDVYVQVVCSTDNLSMYSDVYSFTTQSLPVVPEFRQNLSELNLFSGTLSDLNPSVYVFEYNLHSTLFSDYAHKQRLIALPTGASMTYDGDGLPLFPENTVIAKTFFYNNNETDLSLGKRIIETRILIKIDGDWVSGDYRWNDAQTEATLDPIGGDVPVTWIDAEGESNSITYRIPSDTDCLTCHQTNGDLTPIGPKLRTLNFSTNGINQLQALIDSNLLDGVADPATIGELPKWTDTENYTLEQRARAYFDINCAHCHIEGGFCEVQSSLRLAFETSLEDSNIVSRKNSIINRISNYNEGFSMPFIGTTIVHEEGVEILLEYLDTL